MMIGAPSTTHPLVAQILYSGLGGHGGVVFSMIAADRKRHWRHALGFLGIEPLLPAYRAQCAHEGATCDYIKATARKPWRYYLSLYRWIVRTSPDVVVLHSPTALLPCLAYARTRRIPLVVVEHQPNELKTRQDWLFTRLAMRLADAIVLLTPRYRQELEASLGPAYRHEKVQVIPNGIDTDRFAGARPLAGDAVRIGMAARFTDTKRFDLMVDLLGRLQAIAPHRRWTMTLAGAGEHWESVRRRADAAGQKAIVFEGMLSGETLKTWYRNLDVYCHATEGETLSVAVLQAMAAGLPIVGSDVEGVSNLLKGDPPVGRLVLNQTADSFAQVINELVAKPDEARAMARSARRLAVERYGQQAMFDAYANLVDNCLRCK